MSAVHGTRARYCRGCRCEQCRAANAAYDRALRARAGLPAHGKRSTYTQGCRCDECRAANTAYHRARMRGASTTTTTAESLAKLEDFEWLLTCGEWPERAAQRVGWTVRTARWMCSRHRPYLLDRMEAA